MYAVFVYLHIYNKKCDVVPFFTLDFSKYSRILSFYGGLDLGDTGLWPINISYHHVLLIACYVHIILFLLYYNN